MACRSLRAGDLVALDAKNVIVGFVYARNVVNDQNGGSVWYATRCVRLVDFIGVVVRKQRACDPLLDRQVELVGVLTKNSLLYFSRADLRRLYAIT